MDAEQTTRLDWESMHTLTEALGKAIAVHGEPEMIVGIARGGLVPAVLLAHLLHVRDVRVLALTRTNGDEINAPKIARPVLSNPMSVGDLANQDVLVVDDVAGSGDTIAAARNFAITLGAARVRTAVCVLNQANWPAWRAAIRDVPSTPTYIGWRSQGWVIFPWESQ